MTVSYERAVRRLRFHWYGVMVLGIPLACAAVLVAMSFLDAPLLDVGYKPSFSEAEYWLTILLLMVAGVLGFRVLSRHVLVPKKIAQGPLPKEIEKPKDPTARAEVLVRGAVLATLAVLDAPAVLLLLYALISGNAMAAGLAIAYCLISGVVMEPDMRQLLEQTAASVKESGAA